MITWYKENVWLEMRSISRNGNNIIRKSVRFTRAEIRLLLDQSRRLLLEVGIEQHKQAEMKTPPPLIPTLKRCATEVYGFVPPSDEGYASNDEDEDTKKQKLGTQEV
jgi:hypothetical protein